MSAKDTTDNFIEFWKNFQWPEPVPLTYRLYHDDQGYPLFYTMEDLPGDYIKVDQATYNAAPFRVRVIDGTLIVLPPQNTVKKLRPGVLDGTLCDPRDICVIVDKDQSHVKWGLEQNEVD